MPAARRPATSPSHAPMVTWGRRLQVLAAVALIVAPFLPWARVPVLRLVLPVPGLFLHALLLLPAGLLVLAMIWGQVRAPVLSLLVALAALVVTARDMWLVAHRTEYHLQAMQLWLSDVNQALSHLNISPIDLLHPRLSPTDYLGIGCFIAVGAGVLMAVASLVEAIGYTSNREFFTALLGWPRCRFCRHRILDPMRFCPGCGHAQFAGRNCPHCEQWIEGADPYCSWCGLASPPGAGASGIEKGDPRGAATRD